MNYKKLIIIALLSVMTLTSGCALFDAGAIFAGKRQSNVELNILGNTIKFNTTCDGRYNTLETINTDSAIVKDK